MNSWEIISIVLNALLSVGFISSLVTLKSTKDRAAQEVETLKLENDAKASDEWKALYDEQKDKTRELEAKVEKLQKDNDELREQNATLREKIAENTSAIITMKAELDALKRNFAKTRTTTKK